MTQSPGCPELSIIVPTYNEIDNVAAFVASLHQALPGVDWEVVLVDDDSPDGTAQRVRELARADRRVRCIQRLGRRGLSSACIEGMLSSSSPYLAVMDADLQHDETLLPRMLDRLRTDSAEIVVASRYMEGGEVGDWDGKRVLVSRFATRLAALATKTELSDPMSGFFMLQRPLFERSVRSLSGIGFKILLDILASVPEPVRLAELPYRFRTRQQGASKLDAQAIWTYVMLLIDKTFGHLVPARFVAFILVGAIGILIHFSVLTMLFHLFTFDFTSSQTAATLTAIAGNYSLNNILTYRDQRLRGWRWWGGLLSFTLVCSVGAVANVGIAAYLFSIETAWFLAAIAGILLGAVWNYAVSTVYTWKAGGASGSF